VTVLASGIQQPATRLLSDGTTLFWTNYLQSAGLLAVPAGGGEITTLVTGIVHLVDVDEVNVYVIVGGSLTSIGAGNVGTYYSENASLIRIPKNGAAATNTSGGGPI
jgi:hypothetical protein